MLRLRLQFSGCSCGLVFETVCETEVVCVLGSWIGSDRRLLPYYNISSDTCLSKSEQQLPSSSSTLSSSDSSGAWISSHFFGSKWDPLTSACGQGGARDSLNFRRSSVLPRNESESGTLPLFFMQLLLSHMFLSFMVQTSPLRQDPTPWGYFSHLWS